MTFKDTSSMTTTAIRLLTLKLAALFLALPGLLSAELPFGANSGRTLKLLNFNIELCTIYDAEGNKVAQDCTGVIDVLQHYDPDFVALTEIRNQAQAQEIANALGYNLYFGYALEGAVTLGDAILTKHPILEGRRHLLPHEEWEQRVMVEILSQVDGRPIRVYSTHLTFNNRSDKAAQVMAIMDILAQRTEPRILMGDFNDMDNRPNAYSPRGYMNLITGAGHGTIMPSVPKMYDLHRKVAIPSQRKNDPPYYSLRTDWDPPMQEANTISHWLPRVRIDCIFVSPEFHLGAPHNKAWVIDTSHITAELHPGKDWVYISDHRPVYAEVLLPKPPVQLFLNPQQGPTVFTVGESRVIHVGGIDADGNAVSLLRTDHNAPPGDPAQTGRIVQGVQWTYTGSGGHIDVVDPMEGYDPYIRGHRPASGKVRFTATSPGEGVLRASIGGVQASLNIKVFPEGTEYIYGM